MACLYIILSNFSLIDESLNDPSCLPIEKKLIPYESAPSKDGWLDEKYLDSLNGKINHDTINEDSLAYVMYTSGSTGKPKGVQVTNANILAWNNNMSFLYECKPGFIASQTYDLSFDLSVSDIFHTFVNGGVLTVLPEEEQLFPVDFINRESIEFWSSVPTLLNFI